MELELRIESLQLNDLPPLDYRRFGGALEHELQRLIDARGLPAAWSGGGGEIALDVIEAPAHMDAESLGVQLAQTIYAAVVSGQSEGA